MNEIDLDAVNAVVRLTQWVHALRAQRDAVLALHARFPIYELADMCTNRDDHLDEHTECDRGEWICWVTPLPDEDVCAICTYDDGEKVAWPCETARALGVTE